MAKIPRLNTKLNREKERQDLGFGTTATSNTARLINQDGTFNVKRKGQSFRAWMNSYHRLITMPWHKFLLVILASYFTVNLVFALLYYFVGIDQLAGVEALSKNMSPFWAAFFFSSQTLTTVGYGHISPVTWLSSSIASIEALVGLMMFAIITGLLYARFSRPNPIIRFSDFMTISPYLDMNALMFRIINEKSNQLINVVVNVSLSRNETNEEGKIIRKYYTLDLERKEVKFFATTWTIVHPITADSPLYGMTQEMLENSDAEIMISIEGTDDTYADLVNVRKSYLYNEIEWGIKFTNILTEQEGKYVVELKRVNDTFPTELNNY